MPCDQIRTTIVEMQNLDGPLLLAALQALGYAANQQGNAILFSEPGSYRIHRYEGGRLTIAEALSTEQQTVFANRIKQAYSGQVVRATAARFGWQLKQNPQNQSAFIATRRG